MHGLGILKGKEKQKAGFSPYPSNRDNRILNSPRKKSRIWLLRPLCQRVEFLPRKQLGTCSLVGGQPGESKRVHLEQVFGVAFIVNTGQTLFSRISQHWLTVGSICVGQFSLETCIFSV